jgi:transcription antitermination factor NusG
MDRMDRWFGKAEASAAFSRRHGWDRQGCAIIDPALPMRWHVLTAYDGSRFDQEEGSEARAAAFLAARRFGVYLPYWTEVVTKAGGRITGVRRLLFPGYILVLMAPDGRNYSRALACPGVLDFVRWGDGRPAIVPDEFEAAVRKVELELMEVREWRDLGKPPPGEEPLTEIVLRDVRAYSAIRDDISAIHSELKAEPRRGISLLTRALMLPVRAEACVSLMGGA